MPQSVANPFARLGCRSPRMSEADAASVVARRWGRQARVATLGSHRDQNFLVDAADGRFVLKVASSAFAPAELDLQNRAMEHVAADLGGVVPVPVPATDGAEVVDVAGSAVRLVTYVDGEPLRTLRYVAPGALHDAGQMVGRAAAALETFVHPAGDRVLQWDARWVGDVVAAGAPSVGDPRRRALLERMAERAAVELAMRDDELRRQIIHGDATDWNVLVRLDAAQRPVPCGLIDFGDATRSWLAAECAVLATAVSVRRPERALQDAVEVVRGFHAAMPLREPEIAALPALMLARAALSAVGGECQAALEPDDAYVVASAAYGWRALATVAAIPAPVARAAFRAACGMPVTRRRAPTVPWGASVVALDARRPAPLDLSHRTDTLRFGAWRDPAAIAAVAAPEDETMAIGRYGERRIVHDTGPTVSEPATVHLGVDLFVAAGAEVRTPLRGRVLRVDERELVLAGEDGPLLRLAAVEPAVETGARLDVGARVARVAQPAPGDRLPAHVHVQVVTEALDSIPGLAPRSLADAWLAVCPDPSALLGLPAAAPQEPAARVRERRRRFVADAHELFYAPAPPQMERGWRQWLYDASGRPYLDVVNNVAIVGHSHPRVEEAAARQLRLLNTNSRFLYDAMGRFAERLAGLAPDPLDVALLVCTGSEANDLALQIARAVTGQETVVSLEGCYHGWTAATHELLTGSPRTHAVVRPNAYNGPYRGADTGERYAAEVDDAVDRLVAAGRPPAAFICEPLLGNSGGVPLPAGYLERVYGAVRTAGALCIADEVQVGYGRLGHHFWAFEQQGVAPDIVTLAKATGNGHPIAAVLTTRDIADRFSAERAVFSSAAGGPVSCEVAMAVLDTLRDERLVERARDVGDRLERLLEPVVDAYPLVGAQHGLGLYRGLELVRDGDPSQPAREEAYGLCERLLELGVVMQPTGAGANVLKIKPPLCFGAEDAEYLVEALRIALDDGW